MNDMFRNLLKDNVINARDQATWEASSTVERATFNAVEGILALIALFGCVFISSAMQNQTVLLYVCGLLWLVPFIVAGTLLARFRRSIFVRVRGTMNNFLGGGPRT